LVLAVAGEGLVRVAKKVSSELLLWCATSSISLGVSASVIANSVRALLAHQQVLINAFLAPLGTIWFLLSATLLYNAIRIEWRHRYSLLLLHEGRVLSDDEVVRLVKDTVSLYRGYRWYLVLVGVLALGAGAVMIALSVHGCIAGFMGVGESVFRFSVGLLVAFFAATTLYLEEVFMAGKLARVRFFEAMLSELLEQRGPGGDEA